MLECFPDCEVLLNEQRENSQINLVDIQDAEYMHDPGVSNTYHCPAQCSASINNQIIKLVIDTGAGGCVVSSKYLTTIDPDWESKVSALHQNLWQGYGSKLKPRGMYNTDVIFPHPRGGIRCRVKFAVIENESLPNYFIIGNDCIRSYGIKLNLHDGYFTFGRNLKSHFHICCKKDHVKGVSTLTLDIVDNISTTVNQDVPVGRPTEELKKFEVVYQEAHWDKALAKEDKEEI